MTQKFYLLSKSLLTKIALVAALMSWGGIAAEADEDPNLEVIFVKVGTENGTAAWKRYITTYSTEGVTLNGFGGLSATPYFGTSSTVSSTTYYCDNSSVASSASNVNQNYFSVKTTSLRKIKKVSFLLTPNLSSSTTITPVVVGWGGMPSGTADYVDYSISNTVAGNTYSAATWYDYDIASDKNLKEVRLYSKIAKNIITVGGTTLPQTGGNALRIYGVRVWLETLSVNPSTPTVSLAAGEVNGQTAFTISSIDAETVYYCWSDSEVAPSQGDAAYSSVSESYFTTKVPNVTATKYLHVYGYNSVGTSTTVTYEYNITQVQLPANLSYNRSALSIAKGGTPYNTFNNPNGLDVTFSITNNGTGSTINASTGAVTAGSVPGEETITAHSAATDDFLEGTATYTLTVKPDASDLEAISPGYVFIAENFTSKGKTSLSNDYLYDSNRIFSYNTTNVSSSKGKSMFSDGVEYLNCIDIKSNSSGVLVFKVDRPCKITFYAQQVNYSIKVGSAINDNTYGTIGDVSSSTITIPTAGLVYLTGSGSDRYIAGFEVEELTTEVTLAESGWSSYSFGYDLDFANATDGSDAKTLTAYVITSLTNTSATLTSVDTAPASTGVILKGTGSETYTIPVPVSADAVGTNELSASVTATTVDARSVYVVSGGQLKLFTGTEIPANKAYLEASKLPGEARSLSFVYGDDTTTGISNLEKKTLFDGDFMNLAGQRVKAPSKGFYIVNGKKVIIK